MSSLPKDFNWKEFMECLKLKIFLACLMPKTPAGPIRGLSFLKGLDEKSRREILQKSLIKAFDEFKIDVPIELREDLKGNIPWLGGSFQDFNLMQPHQVKEMLLRNICIKYEMEIP